MIEITFPDGSSEEFEEGVTGREVAEYIGPALARAALAIEVDGEMRDLRRRINSDAEIRILTFDDEKGVEVFRHTTAHLLAHAVTNLYPKAEPTIGPVVDEGFYYDFDNLDIGEEDLEEIEEEMKRLVEEDLELKRKEYSSEQEAKKEFKGNRYKIDEMDEQPSAYTQDGFTDLCRGPHLPSIGRVKAFKLTKLAGAYWKGDSDNKMLTRIYGISFPKKKMLEEHLERIEKAKKRDHRKIGKKLDLFSFHDEGQGFPFWHDKGLVIKEELIDFWREEHRKDGYLEVSTPMILKKDLWERSGHWENYQEHMYTTNIDEEEFAVKPMNCPGGLLLYNEKAHSYRDLPLRVGELGLVHRHELSGTLHGLMRVRAFTQDDAHIYMTPDQIKDEIIGLIDMIDKFYSLFNFSYEVELSTKPEKHIGTEEQWQKATDGLKEALDEKGRSYEINEADGAFYGPKIDFHIEDSLGRSWQCATVQLDMALPERFDLTYQGEDGKKHQPVMIHRVIYGALERFIGILIEHYGGNFPLWLNPRQVAVLPITDDHVGYAEEVKEKMESEGLRVSIDKRTESLSKKVRDAQVKKFNYILVVGDDEVEDGTVNVRTRDEVVHGAKDVDAVVSEFVEEVEKKENPDDYKS